MRGRRVLKNKNAQDEDPAPPTIKEVVFSGSFGQCIRARFTGPLSQSQRHFIEETLQKHECYCYIHDIRWARAYGTLVVEVRRNTIQECSRVDIEKAIRVMASSLPASLYR